MRLKQILSGIRINKIHNFKNFNIKSVTHISKDVVPNSLFICISGNNFDGNDFIDDVVGSGAKCIVTERDVSIPNVTTIVVKDCRIAMSIIAKNFYNKCCDDLKIIGIIGTCGKTTTSLILSQMLMKNDKKVGVIGTNGIFINGIRMENNFTTPDPLELHYVFYQMKMLGVEIVVMEVSAQAIYLNKLEGVKLKIGIFTNISKEHLDFFGSMENYVKCKMKYFCKNNMDECVVNVDDFYGRELAFKVNIPCVSYAINEPANSFAVDIVSSDKGLKFCANVLDSIFAVNNNLVGKYNVYNLLAGMTVAKMLGLSDGEIEYGVNSLDVIDGRFNIFEVNNKKIIVDFAHTPESIVKLLSNVREMFKGRIISLFGCVGYSDKEKRMEMASAVDEYSDFIIITTDNRGKTLFDDIAKDIREGITRNKHISIEDRKCAINFGLGMLRSGDVLVLIGKGAENFQMIENKRCNYNELEYVKELLSGGK